jgi:hypothetical protein
MSHSKGIVLQVPISNTDLLPPFVEACIRDGVDLIAIVGEGASGTEELIDELIVGDGSDKTRLLVVTSSHPGETVEEVVAFASTLKADVSLVRL